MTVWQWVSTNDTGHFIIYKYAFPAVKYQNIYLWSVSSHRGNNISFKKNAGYTHSFKTYTIQGACSAESSLWCPHRWGTQAPRRQATHRNGRGFLDHCPPAPAVQPMALKMNVNSIAERTDLPLTNHEGWRRRKLNRNSSLQHLAALRKRRSCIPSFKKPSDFISPSL